MSDDTERAGSEEQGSSEAGQPEEQPFDASDPSQVNQRNRDHKRREHRKREVAKRLMGSRDGREFLWDLLVMCHMQETSYRSNDRDHAFREGERNIGIQIDLLLRSDAHAYVQMLTENGKGL